MPNSSEQSIFFEALELGSAEARARFLDSACRDDVRLRASVEELLRAHDLPDNVLDQPVAVLPPDKDEAFRTTILNGDGITEEAGMVIGPYRLMEQIGEGGFGLVFVAEQHVPVRRKVALKILKPGMDTREVVARFEAERQALAMMDHPNIARVFDAGTTETGRPYFVMELVRGIPITRFCDQHDLSLSDRLELFVKVCRAIQHAHQKGIIHRDIKPSNVLVTLHDAAAVPKVIDFGVAKAIGQSLTGKTIYTRFTAMIGTPLYMSPEQAEMSGLDIDTRSDIYSLGVLLYELLTGSTPFERDRLDSVGLNEMRRIICEEDPPRPSTRLTTAANLKTTQANGQRNPLLLSSTVRGDLDWIVMKSLEKDRSRRYSSASELADDVHRYLVDEPVQARPPSQLYQLQKFARRNRVAIITASMIAVTMLLGTAVSLWQASVAVTERDEKDAALKEAIRLKSEADAAREEIAQFATRMKEANVLVTSGRAHADAERWADAWSDFTEAIERQPNYYNAWTERASLAIRLGLWEPAAADYAKAIDLGVPADNPANWGIPQLFLFNGNTDSHREYCQTMLAQAEQQHQPPSMALIRSCVMASDTVGNPQSLADQAVALVRSSPQEPFDRQPPGGFRPGQPQPGDSRNGKFGQPPPRPADDRSPDGRRLPNGPRPPNNRRFAQQPGQGPPPRPGEPRDPSSRQGSHPRGAEQYIAGVALYRAGRYEDAEGHLMAALDDDNWRANTIVYPILAMVRHRLGNSDEAKEAFVRSETTIAEWSAAMERAPVGFLPIPWFDWIECLLLHREASILLTGFAPADNPALRKAQERARQLITAARSATTSPE
ncbi:MAG: serine/threonine-protein kinase [Planctomycetaceae bacterium]